MTALGKRGDVMLGSTPGFEHMLVAGTFAQFEKSSSRQPVERIEPEDRRHDLVENGGEIVATADMFELVRKHGAQLLFVESSDVLLRQKNGRTENAHHHRLRSGRRR